MDTTRTPCSTRSTRPPRRRLRALAALAVAALAVAGATACDPNAAADCSTDCLDFVAASYGGDQVRVAGTGGVLADVTIYSDAGRTKVVGYARNFELLRYPSMPVTKTHVTFPSENPARVQLAPATTYHYRAVATGAGGKTWTETGSFETMQRTVTVKVTKIFLYDDSDLTGSGEITFDMRANGANASKIYVNKDWSSGVTKDINVTRTYQGLPPQLSLQVRGSDDDCTFSTCTAPSNQWGAVGSNGDTQWSTATINLTLPFEGATGTFEGSAAGGGVGDVGFIVYGTWSVTYYWA